MDLQTSAAFGFMERCDGYMDLPQLMRDFSATIAHFGFNRFIMAKLPAPGERFDSLLVYNTWPAFWVDRYLSQNYIAHDLVPAVLLKRSRPFTWEEARQGYRRTPIDLQIDDEVGDIGMRDGFAVSMGDTFRTRAAVSLASDCPVELTPMHRKFLHMICVSAELRALELLENKRDAIAQLTEREREVLRWAAAGKTAWETAQVLRVAESTVVNHTANARAKLDTNSTTHAVVLAARSRQIAI